MRPACSVVVPAHGRPGGLARCLDALTSLDYPPDRYEVVVVDDGSPVPIPPVVEPYRDRADVRLLRQANAGPAAARNRGARASEADVLAFTDDDCEPEPGWLSRLADALEGRDDLLAGGRTVNALPDNAWSDASQTLVSYLYETFLDGPSPRAFFTSNNLAVRREPFVEAGGFWEGFPSPGAEDRELCARWLAGGGELAYVPEARVRHRHELDARGFLAQHFRYGRGAHRFRARHAGVGGRGLEPVSFYLGMLGRPLRERGLLGGVRTAALLGLAQLATVAGYVREVLGGEAPA